MKFFDYIRFGLKNIGRQKLRTILTVFAITIGATGVVILLSLVFGASTVFQKQLDSSGALTEVTVTSNTDTSGGGPFGGDGGNSNDGTGKKLDDALVASISKIPHVTFVSPTQSVYNIRSLRMKGNADQKISVNNITAYLPDASLDKDLLAGRNLTAADKTGVIVISSSFLEKLGYKDNPQGLVGQTVQLITQAGYTGEGADVPKPPFSYSNGPVDQNAQKAYQDTIQKMVTYIDAQVVGVTAPGFEDNSAFIPLAWSTGLNEYRSWMQDPAAQEAYNNAQQQYQQEDQQARQQNKPLPTHPALVQPPM